MGPHEREDSMREMTLMREMATCERGFHEREDSMRERTP